MHTIDHMIINSNVSVWVQQCEVTTYNMVHSDHNYLEMILNLLFNKKVQKPRHKVYFYEFMNNEAKTLFDKNFKNKVNDCVYFSHDEHCKYMNDSAKDVAFERNENNKVWF